MLRTEKTVLRALLAPFQSEAKPCMVVQALRSDLNRVPAAIPVHANVPLLCRRLSLLLVFMLAVKYIGIRNILGSHQMVTRTRQMYTYDSFTGLVNPLM